MRVLRAERSTVVYDQQIRVETQRTVELSSSHWSLDRRVHPMTVGTLLNCVTELCTAAQSLIEKRPLFEGDGGWRVLQSIVRQLSVPLS